ncbi:hypothetical protein AMTR_s00020p00008140, partial [Amborella trichopoda]
MATPIKPTSPLLFLWLLTVASAPLLLQEVGAAEETKIHIQESGHYVWVSNLDEKSQEAGGEGMLMSRWRGGEARRLMIGSTKPTCTYNECRGCKTNKCRAEQIPVDANDPLNSAYHYRCVCH